MMKQKFAFLGFAFAILGVAACSDKTTVDVPPPLPPPLEISVTPQTVNLQVGQNAQIVAAVTGGATDAVKTVSWASSNTAVATISANGNVVTVAGASVGVATITATATADANVKAAAIVNVTSAGGQPPSITIKSITFGAGNPVNINNVFGQIEITLNLDVPSGTTVSEVKLLANGTEIYSQGISSPELGTNDEAQSLAELVASWNTAAFTINFAAGNATGTFKNGETTLQAQVIGPQGTISAQTSQKIVLNNPAVAYARFNYPTTSQTNPTTGLVWYTGDIVVDVVGVKYSDNANNNLASVSMTNTGSDVASVTDADGSNGFKLTLQKSGGTAASRIDALETAGVGLTVTSVTAGGAPGPTCVVTEATPTPLNALCAVNNGSIVLPAALNWDNVAPTVAGAITLPSASMWIGPAVTVTSLAGGLTITDLGVMGTTNLLQYATAGSTTYTDAPNGTGDIPESTTNTTYDIRIRVCDKLVNCNNSAKVTVGSDKTLPVLVAALANAAANTAVAAGANLNYSVTDVPSGPDATPGKAMLERRAPNVNVCQIGTANTGGNSGCKDPANVGALGTIQIVLPGPDGYTNLTLQGEDNAFNLSAVFNVIHLIDATPPTVGNIALPPTLTGGQSATFTTVGTDNIDVATAQGRLVFNGVGLTLPFGAATSVGTFGFDAFTTTANLSATLPFIQSIYAAGLDPSNTANGDNADAVQFRVTDFGGNVSTNSQPFGQVITAGPVATLDAAQGGSFAVSTPNAAVTVCNMVAGVECPLTTDTPNTTLTATIRGPSGSFANPFTTVYFYRKDAGGTVILIGTAAMVLTSDTGIPGDATGRLYSATLTFDATGLDPQANVPIFAIGVDASGDGLLTAENTFVTIAAGN